MKQELKKKKKIISLEKKMIKKNKKIKKLLF